MLPLQFFGQNAHFVISLFAALVFFAVAWLYFDAWTVGRNKKELVKYLGFLLVALSFVVSATVIDQSVLGRSLLGNISNTLAIILRLVGYLGIIAGQVMDPLQKVPEVTGLAADDFTAEAENSKTDDAAAKPKEASAIALSGFAGSLQVLLPLGALGIAILYWRRATTGLERHLKPLAIAFLLLFISEMFALAQLARGTDNPLLARLVASFGPLWTCEQAFLFIGSVVLGRWVWQYLTRRFESQLFMIFTSVTLAIFLVTTVSFTFLLISSVQKSALDNLQTAAGVLNYAIDGKKAETLANTEAVAENPDVAAAVTARDHKALVSLTGSFLHDKKESSLIITGDSGQVLLRAENPDRYGDSLSSDTLIRRALIGTVSSSVSSKDGVLAPVISIQSAAPIRDASGRVIGAAVVSLAVDNAFVDGIKQSTGLDSAVYAGNVSSATTFTAPDGKTRLVGIKEASGAVRQQVLTHGRTYKGTLGVLNRPFLVVYAPLHDIDNSVIGMLFIGQPQISILQAAGHSIELTFVITAILLLLSIVPAYFIAKYLAYQLD